MPFEQQPGESDRAFAIFKEYLNLGPKRSLVALAKKTGRGHSSLERWSKQHQWPARVRAHAAHLELVEREAAETAAANQGVDWARRYEEQREGEWKARGQALALAQQAIQRWKANQNSTPTLEGIARLLDLASKLGRLATEQPTDSTQVSAELQATLDPEWEAALKKIYGRPLPGEVIDAEVVSPTSERAQRAGPAGTPNDQPQTESPANNRSAQEGPRTATTTGGNHD